MSSGNQTVCSTHVEMFLTMVYYLVDMLSLLHACGDVSSKALKDAKLREFAPRMWRCFLLQVLRRLYPIVCSTHVEMFLF